MSNSDISLAEFKAKIPEKQGILGIDYGENIIGIAVSDVRRVIASPHSSIKRISFEKDINKILDIMKEKEIGGIVIGLPLQMNGLEGISAEKARKFSEKLLKKTDKPLLFWDERLSSNAVEQAMIREADMSRKRRRQRIDKTAAAFILQGVLDAMQNIKVC